MHDEENLKPNNESKAPALLHILAAPARLVGKCLWDYETPVRCGSLDPGHSRLEGVISQQAFKLAGEGVLWQTSLFSSSSNLL